MFWRSRNCAKQFCASLLCPTSRSFRWRRWKQAYPELAAIKPTRKRIEYYFTLSPFLPHYLFAQTAADRITYIDGDLYFFTSPRPVLNSLGEASVAITPHRFSFEYRNHVQYGLFNVAWITYRRCPEGLECLNTYKAECTAWCYDRVEDGRFGDQKYLDAWPGRYPTLKIIEHKGFNLAIWNVHNYMMRLKNNIVMVDDDPLVFYHFASTQMLPDGTVDVLRPASRRPQQGGADRTMSSIRMSADWKRSAACLQQRFPALATAKSDIRYPPAAPWRTPRRLLLAPLAGGASSLARKITLMTLHAAGRGLRRSNLAKAIDIAIS